MRTVTQHIDPQTERFPLNINSPTLLPPLLASHSSNLPSLSLSKNNQKNKLLTWRVVEGEEEIV
jgi:hypothetical protein